jgi:uncharacterized membrane protein YuzA (DUF378 family)
MKANDRIFRVSLAILIAIGLQYFVVGIFTLQDIDFSSFGVGNWLMEAVYIICAISLSLKEK